MKQRNSEELLIEMCELAIKTYKAKHNYEMEVTEYEYRLREHEACGTEKPSTESLKCTEEKFLSLYRKLDVLVKEFTEKFRAESEDILKISHSGDVFGFDSHHDSGIL